MSNISNEALNAFSKATDNEIYDLDLDPNGEVWGWMIEAVETQDSIEDFIEASKGYNERTPAQFGEIAGFSFVAFKQVQLRKNSPRRKLSVIDFGTARVVLETDLTNFT